MAADQTTEADRQLAVLPAQAKAKEADAPARPAKQSAVFRQELLSATGKRDLQTFLSVSLCRRTIDAAHPCLNQHLVKPHASNCVANWAINPVLVCEDAKADLLHQPNCADMRPVLSRDHESIFICL